MRFGTPGKSPWPALIAGAVLTLVAACRGGAPAKSGSALPPSEGGAVQKVAANPDEPSKALPADFESIPVFPGARLEHVRKPKGAMREVLFSTDASLDEVINFYKASLVKNGFLLTATLRMAARRTWSCDFHRGGQQASVMSFPSDQDKSRLTIDLIYEIPTKAVMAADPLAEDFDVVGPGEIAQQSTTRNQKRN